MATAHEDVNGQRVRDRASCVASCCTAAGSAVRRLLGDGKGDAGDGCGSCRFESVQPASRERAWALQEVSHAEDARTGGEGAAGGSARGQAGGDSVDVRVKRVRTSRPCEECGGPVYSVARQNGYPRKRRFCSQKCLDRRRRRRRPRKPGAKPLKQIQAESLSRRTRICRRCATVFFARNPSCRQTFCSRECAWGHKELDSQTMRACDFCHKRFKAPTWNVATVCSAVCRNLEAYRRSRRRERSRLTAAQREELDRRFINQFL